jgi:predicted ribosomally synthesized peptide with SipW-like signal peptide
MKAKTKTKALLMSLCAVLLVAASVLGTMAYLTDSKEVNNTFTVGNVSIKLDEAKVDDMGNLVKNQDDTLADRVTQNAYKLLPGHTYVKDPTVTVLTPSVESYVRMKVTFNNADKIIALCTDPEFEGEVTGVENAFPLIRMVNFVKANAAKWDGIIPDNMVETDEMLAQTKYFVADTTNNTLTYYFYYNETVAAPTADVVLETLFDSITVPEWVTGDQLAKLKDFQINVVAEAIQADGFENAAAAWAKFE